MRIADELRVKREQVLRVAAKHGAGNVFVSGSVARGEETAGSDVDLPVDVAGEPTPWFPGGLVTDLKDLPGRQVQVIVRRSLSPLIREPVLRTPHRCENGARIRGAQFRSVCAHSYFEVDLETIWAIVERDLAVLESAVKQVLEEPPTAA